MPPKQFSFPLPKKPKQASLAHAFSILKGGVESVTSLAELFERSTRARGQGATTHADQDILRAMVVMAGSTLDAVVKRIIQDSLKYIIQKNELSKKEAGKIIQRKLFDDIAKSGGKTLAEALLSPSLEDSLVEFIVEEITVSSYQSVEQLEKAKSLMGIEKLNASTLKAAFTARNQIIHEMDATPETDKAGQRKRRSRKQDDMYGYATDMLNMAKSFIEHVGNQL